MQKTIKRLDEQLSSQLAHLSAEQMQQRRSPERWSVQQIVEHLLLSYKATQDVAEARLAKGTATKAKPSVAQRFGQFMIVSLGVFPYGRRAPAAVDPTNTQSAPLSGAEIAARIHKALATMDEALAEAERLFGRSRRSISHLVLGPMSVAQWRKFHLVHGKHHIKQIAATRPTT